MFRSRWSWESWNKSWDEQGIDIDMLRKTVRDTIKSNNFFNTLIQPEKKLIKHPKSPKKKKKKTKIETQIFTFNDEGNIIIHQHNPAVRRNKQDWKSSLQKWKEWWLKRPKDWNVKPVKFKNVELPSPLK